MGNAANEVTAPVGDSLSGCRCPRPEKDQTHIFRCDSCTFTINALIYRQAAVK